MIFRRYSLCLVLLILISLSGCLTPGPGTAITYSGDLNTTGEQLQMNGTIHDTTGSGPFHNVTLYFYTEEANLLNETAVGTLTGQRDVSLTVSPSPNYIIIDSPDFWEINQIDVVYFVRQGDGTYAEETATARGELPVEPE